MKVLFSTSNKSKIKYFVPYLKNNGIDIVTLSDMSIDIDINETGDTSIQNAIIKYKEYNKISGLITIATDESLYLDNVPDSIQPKTHVRRVNGKRLNDEEMIAHYIDLVNKYGVNGELKGYFVKSVAICDGNKIYHHVYKTERCFLNHQSNIINEGYPLTSIQFVSSLNKYKSELNDEESNELRYEEQKELFDFIINTVKSINNSIFEDSQNVLK